MPLTLYIDARRWHEHQRETLERFPGIVPVAKGNGYGFGQVRLATAAAKLGVDSLAVGTIGEVEEVAAVFPGTIIVLTPYLPGHDPAPPDLPHDRLVRTVGSVEALRDLSSGQSSTADPTASQKQPGPRVIIECLSSLRRHGITPDALPAVRDALATRELEGFAVHMSLDRPPDARPVDEVARWVDRIADAGLDCSTMFVSHLRPAELRELAERCPNTTFRPRIATELWLGARDTLRAAATVLDVHPIRRGERFGYRQRRAPGNGHLVVVAGGSAHGVGLEAPKALRGVLPRAKGVARAGLATVNRTLSPFSWQGRQRWFAEPPHMLVSVLFVPASVTPPSPGDEMTAELRHTTTRFDQVVDC